MSLLVDSPDASRCRGPALAALFLLLISSTLSAQPDNLARLQECARHAADSVLEGRTPGDTICLTVAQHPAAWVVEQEVLKVANGRGYVIGTCPSGDPGTIALAINSAGIEYGEIEDSDSLRRSAALTIGAALPERRVPGARITERMSRRFTTTAVDTISADALALVETSGYPFTKGSNPSSSQGGFWSKIVEPAVVLGATAVVVILLFTVRSQ